MKGHVIISLSAALQPDHVNRGTTKVMTSHSSFYSFNISCRDKRYLSEFSCCVKESADNSAEQEQYS